MIKTLTNYEIYTYAHLLAAAFSDAEQRLPVKVNFPVQKNKATLLQLAQEIEQSRLKIAQAYGTFDPETQQFMFSEENREVASNELEELQRMLQEVSIMTIKYDNLDENLILSAGQMEALMFMIED